MRGSRPHGRAAQKLDEVPSPHVPHLQNGLNRLSHFRLEGTRKITTALSRRAGPRSGKGHGPAKLSTNRTQAVRPELRAMSRCLSKPFEIHRQAFTLLRRALEDSERIP